MALQLVALSLPLLPPEVAAAVRPAFVQGRRAGPLRLGDVVGAERAVAIGAFDLAVADRAGEGREQGLQLLADRVVRREELREVAAGLRAHEAVLAVMADLLL